MGTSSRSSSLPSLTILSRHQGPAIPPSAPTSARSLTNHIVLQLLPRVTPFLDSLRLAAAERSRDRALREEQDAAFRESARRDREKEARRIEEARQTAELEKAAMERQRVANEAHTRISDARNHWRREFRQVLVPLEEPPNVDPIRMTIRLPDGQRLIRLVPRNSTVTSLYCLVDAHFTPVNVAETEIDVSYAEKNLQELILSSGQSVEAWWGFSLFTAYPRQAIPWKSAVRLTDIGLENGGQVVVEMVCKEEEKDEDGYDTERSE